MPPTVNNGADTNTTEKRPPKPTERKCELICRVKYGNSLPDIPFDLKFLMYPFDGQRFVQYNPTSLEKNYKYDILTEHDLGVTIDLINRDLYQSDPYAQLDPADEKLLEDDIHTPHDSVRSRQHSRSVSWLRKSEYISTEQTRFQPQNIEKIEAKVGYNVKKSLREETLYMDRDAQINAINKTFEDSKTEIVKHYCKPNVHPVEVWPVFPDFINWKYPCAQVMFDSDPAPIGKNVPAQIEEMSQAMIRGVMDESGEQFVAYFLPTDRTLEKRREDFVNNVFYREDDEYEYKISREYNWNVKSKASKGYEENYYFVMRPDGVYYNELETRVRLTKRRIKAGQQPNNTKLVVKHRPLDATEHRMQRYRERQIEPIGEEEDSDEMEEETSAPATTTSTTTKPSDTTPSADQPMEDEEGEGADEANNPDEDQDKRDREIRSRSRSQSKEHQLSPKKARSRSKSVRSTTRSKSRSRSRSRSHLKSRSGSRSVSRSRSRSRSKTSHSRSPSGSRSVSRSISRSRSRSRSVARSKTHSRSRSVSASVSRSPSRSRSGTPVGSGSANGTDEE